MEKKQDLRELRDEKLSREELIILVFKIMNNE